jgi:hypothetical protein
MQSDPHQQKFKLKTNSDSSQQTWHMSATEHCQTTFAHLLQCSAYYKVFSSLSHSLNYDGHSPNYLPYIRTSIVWVSNTINFGFSSLLGNIIITIIIIINKIK